MTLNDLEYHFRYLKLFSISYIEKCSKYQVGYFVHESKSIGPTSSIMSTIVSKLKDFTSPVYTIQPVVNTVVNPVCRLYRVNGVSRSPAVTHTIQLVIKGMRGSAIRSVRSLW